jgi:hypothetical protein
VVKYQIFVSSTYEDLKEERDQVIKAILEMGHIPVGMEMFSAADEQQWELIKKQIDQSDYYVVLVAHRYGSMDGEKSYTEKEYDYATSKKIPALGFVIDTDVEWPEKWIENNNDIKKRLEAFKAKVSAKMVSFWKSSEDLYGKCGIALMKSFSANPREGWVRASEANTSEMTAEITRLSGENGKLRARLEAVAEAAVENRENEVTEIIDALRINIRAVTVRDKTTHDWGETIDTNLLAIFEAIAPDLLDEASNRTLAGSVAFHFFDLNYSSRGWPIPTNYLRSYVSDLTSLDLVTSSAKRHSVNDTQAYWMLTDLGRRVHGSIRKNELLRGVGGIDEAPEVDEDDPGEEGASDS